MIYFGYVHGIIIARVAPTSATFFLPAPKRFFINAFTCNSIVVSVSKKYFLRYPIGIRVRLDDMGQAVGIAAAHANRYRDVVAPAAFKYKAVARFTAFYAQAEPAQFIRPDRKSVV